MRTFSINSHLMPKMAARGYSFWLQFYCVYNGSTVMLVPAIFSYLLPLISTNNLSKMIFVKVGILVFQKYQLFGMKIGTNLKMKVTIFA